MSFQDLKEIEGFFFWKGMFPDIYSWGIILQRKYNIHEA